MKCSCGKTIEEKPGILKCDKCGEHHGIIIKPATNGVGVSGE